jgi:hypothetical protein
VISSGRVVISLMLPIGWATIVSGRALERGRVEHDVG